MRTASDEPRPPSRRRCDWPRQRVHHIEISSFSFESRVKFAQHSTTRSHGRSSRPRSGGQDIGSSSESVPDPTRGQGLSLVRPGRVRLTQLEVPSHGQGAARPSRPGPGTCPASFDCDDDPGGLSSTLRQTDVVGPGGHGDVPKEAELGPMFLTWRA